MKLQTLMLLVLAALVTVAAPAAEAKKMYRWVDAQGRVSFSQSPPPAQSGLEVETKELSENDASNQDCCQDVGQIAASIAGSRGAGVAIRRFSESQNRVYRALQKFVSAKRRMRLSPRQIGALAASACMGSSFQFCQRKAAKRAVRARSGSGSGFALNNHTIVTNHHVIKDCTRITTHDDERATLLVAADEVNDLALLRSAEALPSVAYVSAAAAVQLGEPVTVAGFPLRGMLAEQLNVTRGDISSLAGISGDTRHFQLSAPVQPGNSGGPVLNQSGNVVGVVVARLNDRVAYQASGALPQNVNFAIRLTALKKFLDDQQVVYQTRATGTTLSQTALAAQATTFTIPITCHAEAGS